MGSSTSVRTLPIFDTDRCFVFDDLLTVFHVVVFFLILFQGVHIYVIFLNTFFKTHILKGGLKNI